MLLPRRHALRRVAPRKKCARLYRLGKGLSRKKRRVSGHLEPVLTTLAFCKPCHVLSQFSRSGEKPCLADYIPVPQVYPAGRLDYDSEGLMLLTDDGALQHRISHPRMKLSKIYWAQVEGLVDEHALQRLRDGVTLKDGAARALTAEAMPEPPLWPRQPPIRERREIPTSWLNLSIDEGRNRQVRRMTAAAGLPTLRLVRTAIGPIKLGDLQPGQWRELQPQELAELRLAPAPGRSRSGRPHPRKSSRRGRSSNRQS